MEGGEHMKTVIEMAREAGWTGYDSQDERFERLVELARADEREACAKVCDERAKLWPDEGGDAGTCAIYIRERGNT